MTKQKFKLTSKGRLPCPEPLIRRSGDGPKFFVSIWTFVCMLIVYVNTARRVTGDFGTENSNFPPHIEGGADSY